MAKIVVELSTERRVIKARTYAELNAYNGRS
jgi:hypothetical protein